MPAGKDGFAFVTLDIRRMAQLSLFDSSDVVIDEGRGRVVSTRDFIDPSLASRWLAELRAGVAFRVKPPKQGG